MCDIILFYIYVLEYSTIYNLPLTPLPLASEDDITEVGGEFLLDAVLAFADGAWCGVPDVCDDVVRIAKVGAEAADEFLVVEFGTLDKCSTSLFE